MSFLLDTDTRSAYVRRPASIAHRLLQHTGRLATSAVNYAELCVLAYKQDHPDRVLKQINELVAEMRVLPFDTRCAETFGRLRAELIRTGIGVSPFDLQIAATALTHDLTLVTHNTSHFAAIPGLRIEDWVAD